ncbi:hypothetical protein MSG28_000437 [Choristoneura fumiferana]|uniref:Uncharacterized protein n=1 Tax=Choristoneura fumiferana TaxID=7141 RepID=A0ACC0K0L3_CHOFU|nr:hypothetical protein MSG28_000437 [Choristoneura fumiferana]
MNPKNPEARNRQDNPFEGMVISSSNVLDSLDCRSQCPVCGKSRMYFCYSCFVLVSQLKGKVPFCNVTHAAVLAPDDVNIYTYPEVPEYVNDGRTVLLYPGSDARSVQELFMDTQNSLTYSDYLLSQLPQGYNVGTLRTKQFQSTESTKTIFHVEKLPIDRVLLIDSTWNQSRGIYADERLQRIPKIVVQNRASQFWRHQRGSPRWYLSTIEALHQVLLELHVCAWGCSPHYKCSLSIDFPKHSTVDDHKQCKPYEGEYDNLLYFFKYMYEKLHTLYKHEDLLAYKRPMT